jgi:hypothetical protein
VSLFVCEECGCIENTALSNFWLREHGLTQDKRALCTACDPTINEWHGTFPRRKYDPAIDKPAFKDGEWVAASDPEER